MEKLFAFKMDIRTSQANDAFLSLACHSITRNWDMVTHVLATCPFPEHHIADNIIMVDYSLDKGSSYQW